MPPPLPHAPGMKRVVAMAELRRKDGIAKSLYYVWPKEFIEAGKRRLANKAACQSAQDQLAKRQPPKCSANKSR